MHDKIIVTMKYVLADLPTVVCTEKQFQLKMRCTRTEKLEQFSQLANASW